ncbi:MAG: type II toxin-antitoxin system PemK/MazF family toxin, partial [Patescibacteria group bacterium]
MVFDYIKDLQEWCRLKIALWKKDSKVIFKQGEIWWCSLGMNLGEEIFGKGIKFTRPVLIFRKFTSNSFLGLPLTRQEKQGTWYVEITIHSVKNWVMLNQVRVLDKKRLVDRIGTLDDA